LLVSTIKVITSKAITVKPITIKTLLQQGVIVRLLPVVILIDMYGYIDTQKNNNKI